LKIFDNQVGVSGDGIDHASMEQAIENYAVAKHPVDFAMHVATGFMFVNGLATVLPSLEKANLKEQNAGYELKWGTKAPILLLIGRETTKETKAILTHLADTVNVQLTTIDQVSVDKIRDLYQRGLINIRVYIDQRLHAKLFFFLDQCHIKEIFCGSTNLTSSGLQKNLELTAPIRSSDDEKELYQKWFSSLWAKGQTDFDLLTVIDKYKVANYIYFPPRSFFIYLIKILNRDYLFYDIPKSGKSVLLDFQQFDHYSVVNKMRRYGGAILATSVGLGKSYVALEIMRYSILEGKRVLLIVPSKMKATPKSTWSAYLKKPEFDLANKVLVLGDGNLQQKGFDWTPYLNIDVIIIDEAHRFRNMSNKRTNLLGFLSENAQSKPNAELLLMTATPINVHLRDLYMLIEIFYQFHKHLWQDKGINHTYKEYKQKVDELESVLTQGELSDAELRDAIDELVDFQTEMENELIQRSTRATVQEHFKDDLKRISGRDKIIEPKVKAEKVTYSEPYLVKIVEDLPSYLKEIHYEFAKFRINDDNTASYEEDQAHLTFQKWTLFKRFESSLYALYVSLKKLLNKFKLYFNVFSNKTAVDTLDLDDRIKVVIRARKECFDRLAKKLQSEILDRIVSDRDVTARFMEVHFKVKDVDAEAMNFPGDEKISILNKYLGTWSEEQKKVLIFTEYRDTLEYLKSKLATKSVVFAHGQGTGEYYNVASKVFESAELDEIISMFKQDKVKHMVSTDVISEGENLPEADVVLNFDLPYNPVRIIQRSGRATRIDHPKDVLILNLITSFDLAAVAEKLNLRFHNLIAFIGIDFQVWEGFEDDYKAKNQKDIETTGEFLSAWRDAISTRLPDAFVRGTVSQDEIEQVLLRKAINQFNLEKTDLPDKLPTKPIYTTLVAAESSIFALYKIRNTIFNFGVPTNEIVNADTRKYLPSQLDRIFTEIKKRKEAIFNSLQESASIDKKYINIMEKWKREFPSLKGIIKEVLKNKWQSHPLILGLLEAQKEPKLEQVAATLRRISDEAPKTEIMSMVKTFSDTQEPERILAFIQYLKGDELDL
jgi:superfamily II DNA or RNA helicase